MIYSILTVNGNRGGRGSVSKSVRGTEGGGGSVRGNGSRVEVEVIPEKKTILGLILGPIWLATKRLWMPLIAYIITVIVIAILVQTSLESIIVPLLVTLNIFVFLEGNQMTKNKLISQGYKFVDIIDAPDEQTAIIKYLQRNP